MNYRKKTLTIAIPSYSRILDLNCAIDSIFRSNVMPTEILVVDDNSPEKIDIRNLLIDWKSKFKLRNTEFKFIMSDSNDGYDINLQKLLINSTSDYVMFLGNDDILTADGISTTFDYINNSNVYALSRAFIRFNENGIVGISKFSKKDRIFSPINSPLYSYFRLSCFFSGLTFDRVWALNKYTNVYDGSLYYQLYLFGCAFFESGVGYISAPIVGARADGVPLFGSSVNELSTHVPGSYSAKSRAIMWRNILNISRDLDAHYGYSSFKFIHNEIKVRMSFHVFEMYSFKSIKELFDLRVEYKKLGIFNHPMPIILFLIVLVLRKKSRLFFYGIRKIIQR
jgi:hypothetical protein